MNPPLKRIELSQSDNEQINKLISVLAVKASQVFDNHHIQGGIEFHVTLSDHQYVVRIERRPVGTIIL